MKKLFLCLLLPTALVAVLALAVHFKQLPADFWSLSLADKWKAIKAFWTPTPAPTAPTAPKTLDEQAKDVVAGGRRIIQPPSKQ